LKNDGAPRSETAEEETEQIFEHLRNRGDLRIGQYLINAVSKSEKYKRLTQKTDKNHRADAEQVLWTMEAEELLEAIQTMEENYDR